MQVLVYIIPTYIDKRKSYKKTLINYIWELSGFKKNVINLNMEAIESFFNSVENIMLFFSIWLEQSGGMKAERLEIWQDIIVKTPQMGPNFGQITS